jgi:hypothetical protein
MFALRPATKHRCPHHVGFAAAQGNKANVLQTGRERRSQARTGCATHRQNGCAARASGSALAPRRFPAVRRRAERDSAEISATTRMSTRSGRARSTIEISPRARRRRCCSGCARPIRAHGGLRSPTVDRSTSFPGRRLIHRARVGVSSSSRSSWSDCRRGLKDGIWSIISRRC